VIRKWRAWDGVAARASRLARIDSRVIRYACTSPHMLTARLKKLSRSRRVAGEKAIQAAVSR
jgi:hypothetical protein